MSQLFYLKECSSTNDEISKFLLYENSNFIGLHTFSQTKGRGQYGNVWIPTAGKNLAYTLAVNTHNILCSDFIFNYYTANMIRDFLANLADSDVKIKWPNDIILKGKKIVGILIEKKRINQNNYFIIGAGINILQEKFDEITNAGSLLTQTGKEFNLEDFSLHLHEFLCEKLRNIPSEKEILDNFNKNLFRRDEISVFEIEKERQNGIIRYADEKGELWIELENDGLRSFYHKEVKLLY
ncbi:biotin--[acetyl-CoA-carboxylase] ligase [Chryseobacterium indologenes]|uniref:Biotin--[acetyl-CoA-carboxylase] ligase n=1 Tax=Chryseobacterium indologenes TaxID=253 RepID=A0A1Z3W6V3_CHRID|nr:MULTISPECIES: biotin--[acetyl-CoA-carboxylase] ligase [Chryseobacterium]ASE63500.1 biotin--[acetyl-CoA-carboxylase] ligase [Chryseobacterium indologenes]ATN07492.1 biotin--[acetyl-CoA-carboxylase] ligase [Chryseobacterium indologenes]AYY83769.1 biotin--[acetyl-CoA-carboxylase] ligase [Chryseobacterium indologenes]AYZ37588.1 biotin--[acetyl-CoA-carboxylase] ligase [Chryseobacterium indologenes]AZB19211.1 biotin--[acetyl-CoA-carboxylase] ligase [Chryseobacterium indologenes]